MLLVLSFYGLILVAQSNVSLTSIGNKNVLHIGNLIIQTIPSSVMVEIPKLRINGRKLQDSLILEEIFTGEYDLVFRLKRKKIKCKVDVVENKTIHLLVDVKKKNYEVKEIAYKPHLPDVVPVDPSEVYVIVDEMPEFPGGNIECQRWIARQVRYPVEAQKRGIVGRVYVGFVINKTGQIVNVKVLKSAHPLLDAEAIRVIEGMPAWKPGKNKGECVDVSYTFPINFRLAGANVRKK